MGQTQTSARLPEAEASPAATTHDAFISYSRKDKAFAALLEKALEGHRLPKELRQTGQRLRVFRDEEDFTGTEYNGAITRHLSESRSLIVVCSPAARASTFVNDEIRHFAQVHGADRIIPVLLDGVPNNEAHPGQDQELAFPAALMACKQMPLAITYKGVDLRKGKLDKVPFEGAWYTLLANLLDMPRSEVEQRDKRHKARIRNAWITGLSVVGLLLLMLTAWALSERDKAAVQRDEALRSQSTFMAQISRQQAASGQHDLAIKLALDALPRHLARPDRPWVQAAESALYAAFQSQAFRFTFGGPREGLGGPLRHVVLSADGRRAALDYGTEAELWSLETGERLKSLRADNDHSSVEQMVFSPDGRLLVLSHVTNGELHYGGYFSDDTTVRGSLIDVINAKTGEMITRFQVSGHEHNHVSFSPDNKRLFISTNEQAVLVDTATGQSSVIDAWQKDIAAMAPPYAQVRFSEDGSKIALLTEAGTLGLIDLRNKLIAGLAAGLPAPRSLLFDDHAGERLLVGAGTRVLRYQTASRTSEALPLSGDAPVLALGQHPTGGAVTALTRDGRLHTWAQGKEAVRVGPGDALDGPLTRATMAAGAQAAVVETAQGEVRFWDLLKQQAWPVLHAEGKRRLVDMALTPGAQRVALASTDHQVRVWDRAMARATEAPSTIKGAQTTVTAYLPGSGQVALGNPDGTLTLMEADTGKLVWRSSGRHHGEVGCLGVDPLGQRVVSGGNDQLAMVWQAGQPQPPVTLRGHQASVDVCAFSPDGKLVVTGSSDSTFRLWDARTGQQKQVLAIPKEHLDPIHNASIHAQAVFTPDSKTVVTVTAGDGMVVAQPALVWDVATGKLRHALAHTQAAIWDLKLMPDGHRVLTASYDGTAALWNLDTGQKEREFTGHTTRVLRALPFDQGRMLLTATAEGLVRLDNVRTGQAVHQWSSPAALINAELSADGRLLALGSNTGAGNSVVELWDPLIGSKLASIPLPAHKQKSLSGLAFSPDGARLLVTTQAHQLVKITLPPTGQALIDQAWSRMGSLQGPLLTQDQRIRFALASP